MSHYDQGDFEASPNCPSFTGRRTSYLTNDRENYVHFKPLNNTLPNCNIITTSKFQYYYHFQISVLLPHPNFNIITTAKFQYYYHFQISILLPLPKFQYYYHFQNFNIITTSKFQYYYHFKISILLPLPNFSIITTSKF